MTAAPIAEIATALDTEEIREVRARRVAEIIRSSGGFRWVGIYDVGDQEIELIGHTGVQAPAYIRFPVDSGLSGEAVRARGTVVSNDVAHDPRYLTAFESTGSEMVVPILGAETGLVIGTLDIESDRVDAFAEKDCRFGEACAQALMPLFE